MGIFSATSPLDQQVELATSEKNTTDDWGKIVDLCDKINDGTTTVADGLKAITKRIKHENPRVQLQAITLLDACISNCGRKFILKVSEREFEQELSKLLTCTKTHHKVSEKLRECLKKWADGDFRGDPQLGLIPALYMKMQQHGYSFEAQTDSPKQVPKLSSDPNVVQSQQEEDDIAKAIQLSLQETGSSSFKTNNQQSTKKDTGSLYSSASAALASDFTGVAASVPEKEPMKVRALYDFEAAEDNELTFKAGEIIVVSNHNDANWWEGSNHRGEGLFPSNFVTENLYDEEETKQESASAKKVSFSESVQVTEVTEEFTPVAEATGEIDEDKINHLLHILHEADPTAERPDDPDLPHLEEQVNAMGPTIDVDLEKVDRMHAQLARISTDLVGGLNLYHQLMREMPPSMQYYSPYNAMQPGMVSSNIPDVQPSQFMPPVGMPQMYPPPGQHPYMPMSSAAEPYIPSMQQAPPQSQPDMTAMPTHPVPPPSEFPQGQPPTSYPGQPTQMNYAPYTNPYAANTNFESQAPMYSQAHVSAMAAYPAALSGMMDPNGPVSNPNMMHNQPAMPPQMHLPHYSNAGPAHLAGHMAMAGQPGQMHPGPYPSNMSAVQSSGPASMAPQTSVSYQPPAMQQPLL